MTALDVRRMVVEESATSDIPNISEFLAQKTGLSKGRVKHALNCGALRVKKRKGGYQRVRRATASVPAGAMISFHYDDAVLTTKPPEPELVEDVREYSVWFKPPGLLTQGTEWGDHCSLLRQVELHFQNKRQVFPIHRLDRDACGLVVVAHTGYVADKLSRLFSSREVEKVYQVRVAGEMAAEEGMVEQPLDGKDAVTLYRKLESGHGSSLLSVRIETGRKHQIRRHLSAIGHPVLGDTLYGESAKDGLHLCAVSLSFTCPVSGRPVNFSLQPERIRTYWH